jgi:hypothetical protein
MELKVGQQALYHLSHTPIHFALVILEMESYYLPGWPRTAILLILASQLAKLTGMSHGTQLSIVFFTHITLKVSF